MSSRLEVGSKWGRWTVVKHASPAQRYGEPGARARVVVRCVCGASQTMWENDLRSRKSGGCRSAKCAAKHEAAEALREHLRAGAAARSAELERELETFLLEPPASVDHESGP